MIVTRRGSEVFAFDNVCPHAGHWFDETYGGVIRGEEARRAPPA
jgi:nitrite reductase/ring-hydroxylating ferredoxin subunit